MTREEHLQFCKICVNRRMDRDKGLVCGLTGQKADFDGSCSSFIKDETVKEILFENTEGLSSNEIQQIISPKIFEKFKEEQNLNLGILYGSIVGILGAILWGVIALTTGLEIGFVALAIGAGVGLTVRYFGKGIETKFGLWGAGIAFLSVVLGKILSIIGFIASYENISYFETMFRLDYSALPGLFIETSSIVSIMFYFVAIFEGYKFSFRIISDKEIKEMQDSDL